MEIRIDGNRSSAESWTRAQAAPLSDVPSLSEQQKAAAASMGINEESYARNFYAGDLERPLLASKLIKVGRVIERIGRKREPNLTVQGVWLKTFEGKLLLDVTWKDSSTQISLSEDVVDALLESGSELAEERIVRVIDLNVHAAADMRAS